MRKRRKTADPEARESPQRSRLLLLAMLALPLLLGGGEAQCSFVSGEDRHEEDEDDDGDEDDG